MQTSERLAGTDVHLGTVTKSDNDSEGVLSYEQLESDGRILMRRLLNAQASAHMSAINLMTWMQCVQRIARCRPFFLKDVVTAFEALHANLPPTLTPSQVWNQYFEAPLSLVCECAGVVGSQSPSNALTCASRPFRLG